MDHDVEPGTIDKKMKYRTIEEWFVVEQFSTD